MVPALLVFYLSSLIFLDADELVEVLKAIGESSVSKSQAQKLIKAVDLDDSGTIEWNEFLEVMFSSYFFRF